jgi:hypothetical protein
MIKLNRRGEVVLAVLVIIGFIAVFVLTCGLAQWLASIAP